MFFVDFGMMVQNVGKIKQNPQTMHRPLGSFNIAIPVLALVSQFKKVGFKHILQS